MAMTITPGYDFGVTEIPTKAKLELALGGMSLTGIDISQIDVTLVAVLLTSSTGLTLPAEGWMDYDQLGRLWVQTRWGLVAVYRGNWGGWETRRYPCFAAVDTYTYPISSAAPIGQMKTFTAGNSTESQVGYRPGTSIGIWPFKNENSAASGAHVRVLARGGWAAEVLTSSRVPANQRAGGSPDYMRRQSLGVQDQTVTGFPANTLSTNGTGRKRGLALRQAQGSVRCIAWWFGMESMQD